MTFELLLALAVFAFISSVTPGPNNLMVMASGANFGVGRTLPHFFGVLIGFNFMIWMVGVGLIGALNALPGAIMTLKVLSAGFLLYLAWKIATAAPLSGNGNGEQTGKPLTFFQAAAFQWINPKAWALSLAAVGAYADDTRPVVSIAIIAAVFIAAGAPSVSLWLFLGAQLRRFFSNPGQLRLFNYVSATLLIATLWPILSAA